MGTVRTWFSPRTLASHADLFTHRRYLSYQELFEKKIDRVTEAFKIVRTNDEFLFRHMKQKVKMEDLFEHNGIFLHFTMALNYIKAQGSKQQQSYWLEKARNGDFLMAYAQVDL